MLLAILSVVSAVISLTMGAEPPGGYYTTRYDHIDIENILNHKRLVMYYGACLLDKGPCTPQGTEFKRILPEAIKTNCLRCTEKQRVVTTRSIKRLKKEYPDVWIQLEKKWDPTGENVKRLLASVNKPVPVSEIPLIFDRFGEENSVDQNKPTTRVPTVEISSSTLSSTTRRSITTSGSTTRPPVTTSSTTIKAIIGAAAQTSTVKVMPFKPVTSRPFNSIGPNLILPNPKALIDKVIQTASVVLDTVTGVLQG